MRLRINPWWFLAKLVVLLLVSFLLWAPLAPYYARFLLHASLLIRVAAGDAAGLVAVWRWSGVANVAAVLVFLGGAGALSAARRRRGGRGPRHSPSLPAWARSASRSPPTSPSIRP